MAMQRRQNVRLPPEVNRILYVRNLPYKITAEEMYDIFGKYGAIRQIRVIICGDMIDNNSLDRQKCSLVEILLQNYDKHPTVCFDVAMCNLASPLKTWLDATNGYTPETKGTAYVIYEDIFDAKNACDHLSGFNVCNRYLVVLYYQANRAFKKMDQTKKKEELDKLKSKYGLNDKK